MAGLGHNGIDGLVTGAISKCWKREIDKDTLVAFLSGERAVGEWAPHLGLFFSELSMESTIRFLLANSIKARSLAQAYEQHLARGGDRRPELEGWIYG